METTTPPGGIGAFARVSYTIEEAARATGLTARLIRAAITSGDLVAHYPTEGRGKAVIRAVELDAWLSSTPTDRRT